jgi:hypothetical protein
MPSTSLGALVGGVRPYVGAGVPLPVQLEARVTPLAVDESGMSTVEYSNVEFYTAQP